MRASTVARRCMLCPSLSSLVTTSTSSPSNLCRSFVKPFRSDETTELLTVSEMTRAGSTVKPAVAISRAWFTGV